MDKNKEKVCPVCQGLFICQAENIMVCPCRTIKLGEATKNSLAKSGYDCLCRNCLDQLDRELKMGND